MALFYKRVQSKLRNMHITAAGFFNKFGAIVIAGGGWSYTPLKEKRSIFMPWEERGAPDTKMAGEGPCYF